MRPIASFKHMLPDLLTYARSCATRDNYGRVSHGTPVTYSARVVGEQKLITSFSGAEVRSEQTVYVGAALTPHPEDQVTLSTAITGSTQDSYIHPSIVGAMRIPDQTGVLHSVLYLA